MKRGKVYLVGAGPADAGLLTVKGKTVLEQAEVVVYDRLVGAGVLLEMPEQAEKIDVGKRAGHHTLPQNQINQLLLEKALEGKTVVRLKGGDPFLFGRGGEELELLARHGIPFEVVPGVTSAISVPAYSGIPVTHRDAASSLHIITGHKRAGEACNIPFEALVQAGGTLVFLMSVTALPDICEGLLKAGLPPETPAAVLERGTTARQRRVAATVSTLPDEAKRQNVQPPAIIVVGGVCAYAEEFAWAERLPLFGTRIAVTRPRDRDPELTQRLRELGAEVLEFPTIKTVPIPENPALDAALERLESFQYLAFTSPAGARYFCEAMARKHLDLRRFPNGKIAAIGSGTAKELRKHGIIADLVPEIFDGAHLGKLLGEACRDGDRVLLPRARNGSRQLIAALCARRQVDIADIPIYDTVYESPEGYDLPAAIAVGELDLLVFTSASTVKGFEQLASNADLSRVCAVCIGEQTQKAAEALGIQTVTAARATPEALAEAALQWKRTQ